MSESPMNTAVAAELRAERAAVNLTIQQLTDRTEYSRGSIMRWLNGERDISIAVLSDIATALGTDSVEILTRAQKRVSEAASNVTRIDSKRVTTDEEQQWIEELGAVAKSEVVEIDPDEHTP